MVLCVQKDGRYSGFPIVNIWPAKWVKSGSRCRHVAKGPEWNVAPRIRLLRTFGIQMWSYSFKCRLGHANPRVSRPRDRLVIRACWSGTVVVLHMGSQALSDGGCTADI